MAKKRRTTSAITLLRSPAENRVGVFSIQVGKRIAYYTFSEIRCDIGGRGFAVHRIGLDPTYHVRIGEQEEISCECLGFLAHGQCKHVRGLMELIRDGRL
jgi:hypothetical protein